MQLPSSWTRARVKAGRFASPATSLPAMPRMPRMPRTCRWIAGFLIVFYVKNGSCFGISILLVDLVRDFFIGTGFLEPKIAPEPPPGRDIAGGYQKAAHLPL